MRHFRYIMSKDRQCVTSVTSCPRTGKAQSLPLYQSFIPVSHVRNSSRPDKQCFTSVLSFARTGNVLLLLYHFPGQARSSHFRYISYLPRSPMSVISVAQTGNASLYHFSQRQRKDTFVIFLSACATPIPLNHLSVQATPHFRYIVCPERQPLVTSVRPFVHTAMPHFTYSSIIYLHRHATVHFRNINCPHRHRFGSSLLLFTNSKGSVSERYGT